MVLVKKVFMNMTYLALFLTDLIEVCVNFQLKRTNETSHPSNYNNQPQE